MSDLQAHRLTHLVEFNFTNRLSMPTSERTGIQGEDVVQAKPDHPGMEEKKGHSSMTNIRKTWLLGAAALAAFISIPGLAMAQSNPSVVVTIENAQPSRGVFLTPVWMGIHDGSFDSYDGGQAASVPLGGNEIESLAEDGNNGPITATFESLLPSAPQVQGLAGPSGPIAPGDRAAVTFNVDPSSDRYFSYASMIIPSNDFFIANGNPVAHELFDADGNFVGSGFVVSGDETNDAGTEQNDEIASNVAFLNQGGPNIGTAENGVVVTPAPGFADPGALTYPNGVLNYPVFALGDFNDADDALLKVSFQYVDLGGVVQFRADLDADQEVTSEAVNSGASGFANVTSFDGSSVRVKVRTKNLSGPIVAAHLHYAQAGANGPVVVNMGSGINGDGVFFNANDADLTGPLSGMTTQDLVNGIAAGNVYINIHTAANPGGEIRGQIALR